MDVNEEDVVDLLYRMVGDNIRIHREGDRTQQELADEVGIGRTSITNLEQGKQRVPLHHLLQIAHVLEVDLTELVPTWSELEDEIAERQLEGRPKAQEIVDDFLKGEE